MAVTATLSEKPAETINSSIIKPDSVTDSVVISSEEYDSTKIKNAHLGSTQQHVFSDSVSLSYWTNTYETAKYEGRHRLDPQLQWSAAEEKRLVRKVCHSRCSSITNANMG